MSFVPIGTVLFTTTEISLIFYFTKSDFGFFFAFHAKSDTTNNRWTELSDIAY